MSKAQAFFLMHCRECSRLFPSRGFRASLSEFTHKEIENLRSTFSNNSETCPVCMQGKPLRGKDGHIDFSNLPLADQTDAILVLEQIVAERFDRPTVSQEEYTKLREECEDLRRQVEKQKGHSKLSSITGLLKVIDPVFGLIVQVCTMVGWPRRIVLGALAFAIYRKLRGGNRLVSEEFVDNLLEKLKEYFSGGG